MFWQINPQAPLSVREAADRFCQWNCGPRSPPQEQAYQNLSRGFARLGGNMDFDFVFKVFNDFDALFFSGVLRHRVHLLYFVPTGKWHQFEEHLGVTMEPYTLGPHQARILVGLNKIIQEEEAGTRRDREVNTPLATLLHEMVHAYLSLMTAAQDLEPVPAHLVHPRSRRPCHLDAHGESFWRCVNAIQRNLKHVNVDLFSQGEEFFQYLRDTRIGRGPR